MKKKIATLVCLLALSTGFAIVQPLSGAQTTTTSTSAKKPKKEKAPKKAKTPKSKKDSSAK